MPRNSDRAFESAAISVVRQGRMPLRLREITERVIEEALISPTGGVFRKAENPCS